MTRAECFNIYLESNYLYVFLCFFVFLFVCLEKQVQYQSPLEFYLFFHNLTSPKLRVTNILIYGEKAGCLFCPKLPPHNWQLWTTAPSPLQLGQPSPSSAITTFLLCPVQPRAQLLNLTSWPSWHLEAGDQVSVFPHSSGMMIILDSSVG